MNAPTVLEALKTIPDPRKRQGRQYPLYGLLAVLLLAAMHGERSLRGMWLWAKQREKEILFTPALGFRAARRIAGLGTFWYALSKLKGGELERAMGVVLPEEQDLAVDGKVLRGSKRRGEEEALKVISLVGTSLKQVWEQQAVDGDELQAAIRLLDTLSLEGKVISADAGILKAPFVQKVVEKGGDILA